MLDIQRNRKRSTLRDCFAYTAGYYTLVWYSEAALARRDAIRRMPHLNTTTHELRMFKIPSSRCRIVDVVRHTATSETLNEITRKLVKPFQTDIPVPTADVTL